MPPMELQGLWTWTPRWPITAVNQGVIMKILKEMIYWASHNFAATLADPD